MNLSDPATAILHAVRHPNNSAVLVILTLNSLIGIAVNGVLCKTLYEHKNYGIYFRILTIAKAYTNFHVLLTFLIAEAPPLIVERNFYPKVVEQLLGASTGLGALPGRFFQFFICFGTVYLSVYPMSQLPRWALPLALILSPLLGVILFVSRMSDETCSYVFDVYQLSWFYNSAPCGQLIQLILARLIQFQIFSTCFMNCFTFGKLCYDISRNKVVENIELDRRMKRNAWRLLQCGTQEILFIVDVSVYFNQANDYNVWVIFFFNTFAWNFAHSVDGIIMYTMLKKTQDVQKWTDTATVILNAVERPNNIAASIVLTLNSIIGMTVNGLLCKTLYKQKHYGIYFRTLTFAKAYTNFHVLTVFFFAQVPPLILNNNIYPNFIKQLCGALTGLGYLPGRYFQFFICFGTVYLSVLPMRQIPKSGLITALIISPILGAILFSGRMSDYSCSYTFDVYQVSWFYYPAPCSQFIQKFLAKVVQFQVIVSCVMNCFTFGKLCVDINKNKMLENSEMGKRMKKNKWRLVQCVTQEILFVVDISVYFNEANNINVWIIFFFNTFAWNFAHNLDGIIMYSMLKKTQDITKSKMSQAQTTTIFRVRSKISTNSMNIVI